MKVVIVDSLINVVVYVRILDSIIGEVFSVNDIEKGILNDSKNSNTIRIEANPIHSFKAIFRKDLRNHNVVIYLFILKERASVVVDSATGKNALLGVDDILVFLALKKVKKDTFIVVVLENLEMVVSNDIY